MSQMVCKEVAKISVPYTKEQLEWILTHVRLTRKGKKLAKQFRRLNICQKQYIEK